MSSSQSKHVEKIHHTSKEAVYKTHTGLDVVLFVLAFVVMFAGLWFVPKLLAQLNLSFLAPETGLAKFLATLISVLAGLVVIYPSSLFKNLLALSKGARLEWRKSVKPERSLVSKTTLSVLVIVLVLTLFLFGFDSLLFMIFKSLLS